MPDFLKLVSALREQMSASLSRSDVLRPLSWLIGICIAAFLIALVEKAPIEADWLLGVLLALEIALYIFAYVYCLLLDRDALRSERYSLSKLALQHRMIGDSESGLFDAIDGTLEGSSTSTPRSIEQKK